MVDLSLRQPLLILRFGEHKKIPQKVLRRRSAKVYLYISTRTVPRGTVLSSFKTFSPPARRSRVASNPPATHSHSTLRLPLSFASVTVSVTTSGRFVRRGCLGGQLTQLGSKLQVFWNVVPEKQGLLPCWEKVDAFPARPHFSRCKLSARQNFFCFSSCPVAPPCLLSPPKGPDECVDFLQHYLE